MKAQFSLNITSFLSNDVKTRGGNGSDVDRIVTFPHPFSYFIKQIRMQL
jgi:hypothetical protein